MNKLFNRGIAEGIAFCNRVEETQQLLKNIKNITHTLIFSPRRYGKTSLALHAIDTSKLPYAHIDLFMKYKKKDIEEEFYQGISKLISQIVSPTEKALQKMGSLIKNVKISLTLKKMGLEFCLEPETPNHEKNLKSLFEGIDQLLSKTKKKAIIFVDEIQTITESNVSDEIESALRFVAQKTQNMSFVFSGSSRHLLSKIFDDRSRPFYKLCAKMHIYCIADHHYRPFINRFAKEKWQTLFSNEVLEALLECTHCHPYYVNVLCEKLFELKQLPNEKDIYETWKKVCQEEQSTLASDIALLTPKQKQLLNEIAKHPRLKAPTSKDFVNKVDLTPRGVSHALKILLQYDIIEKTEEGIIRIIDPMLIYWLK